MNGSLTVLVVEDEWLVRDTIADFLREEGCTVIEASSGEDALAFFEDGEEIDVVFTDIRLGGSISGWDVGAAAHRENPEVGVIYTSGQTIESPRQVPQSLFFRKPWNPADILAACRDLATRS